MLGAVVRATASIESSTSTPTQSKPSSASRIATRPVPQPASRTRPPGGSSEAQSVASPCMSLPVAASRSNRAAYSAPDVPPVSSSQRVLGSSGVIAQ
jgi:hypothetical protein